MVINPDTCQNIITKAFRTDSSVRILALPASSFPWLIVRTARAERRALVRLRAHLNGAVKVRYLADTVRPVTESNCIGAISPGGEQLEVNDQSVTRTSLEDNVNSIRSAVLASPLGKRRSPKQNTAASVEGVDSDWQRTADGWRQNGRKFG